MQRIRKITAIILSILTLSGMCVFGTAMSAGAKGTGRGLAEWALNAYYSGWSYVYGGSTPGAVDCSGLIYSYCGGERCGDPQLNTATERGSVSNGIPRIHGLGLWRPGHVGVYVGDGMEVDARNSSAGVKYESVYSAYLGWNYWFKLAACTYPTTGWEKFNGEYYYYEDGEYIVNTSRTIDGVTYNFDSKGVSSKTPEDMSSTASSSNNSSQSKPKVWKNGSTGKEVKKIQKRLTELGFYTGAIDGEFGNATEIAYRAFQAAAGLVVDGIAGSDRKVLYSDDAPRYVPEETKPTEKEDEPETTTEEETDEADKAENAETENSDSYELKNGDNGEAVTALQTRLTELGYYSGVIDGDFGMGTEQSILNFQLANNFEANGIVDAELYEVIFGETALENPHSTEISIEENVVFSITIPDGPVEMPSTTNPSKYIVANEKNQSYADTASDVVAKANKSANKALANSTSAVVAAKKADVQRTANAGLWFAVVAVILGTLSAIFFARDRKAGRYQRYCARKKKRANSFKAEANTRW